MRTGSLSINRVCERVLPSHLVIQYFPVEAGLEAVQFVHFSLDIWSDISVNAQIYKKRSDRFAHSTSRIYSFRLNSAVYDLQCCTCSIVPFLVQIVYQSILGIAITAACPPIFRTYSDIPTSSRVEHSSCARQSIQTWSENNLKHILCQVSINPPNFIPRLTEIKSHIPAHNL